MVRRLFETVEISQRNVLLYLGLLEINILVWTLVNKDLRSTLMPKSLFDHLRTLHLYFYS